MSDVHPADSTYGCLFPDCPSPRVSRGLCRTHYQTALHLIRRGLTSWKSLEGQSKAAPPGLPVVVHRLTFRPITRLYLAPA